MDIIGGSIACLSMTCIPPWARAGRSLHVIPDLDIVMVTTHGFSGNPRDYAEEAESYQFLLNYLIPATIEP